MKKKKSYGQGWVNPAEGIKRTKGKTKKKHGWANRIKREKRKQLGVLKNPFKAKGDKEIWLKKNKTEPRRTPSDNSLREGSFSLPSLSEGPKWIQEATEETAGHISPISLSLCGIFDLIYTSFRWTPTSHLVSGELIWLIWCWSINKFRLCLCLLFIYLFIFSSFKSLTMWTRNGTMPLCWQLDSEQQIDCLVWFSGRWRCGGRPAAAFHAVAWELKLKLFFPKCDINSLIAVVLLNTCWLTRKQPHSASTLNLYTTHRSLWIGQCYLSFWNCAWIFRNLWEKRNLDIVSYPLTNMY